MQWNSDMIYIINSRLDNIRKRKCSGVIDLRKNENQNGNETKNDKENAAMKKDIEFLEKAFKKWTPNMLSSPYIPTPSVLVKGTENSENTTITDSPYEPTPTAKPSLIDLKKKFDNILNYLHKGALAYSMGDYGTAINNFTRLLETNWLKHTSFFYLIKTLIKLDIEKEILSLKNKHNPNIIRMTKVTS